MQIERFTTTIAISTALSGLIDLQSYRLLGIKMPTTAEGGWTAADLTFQISPDGGTTFINMYDETGTEVLVKAAVDREIRFSNPGLWLAVRHFRIRSGTSGTPVNQAAARSLILLTAP
jgi:hypothetical protein